ncbi:MAG: tubulin-like doman-containing protein, partial [Planctomycetota bacterium]
ADTADALDFISREHELAHLDIKPENLLLVAGHVKVGDFGLVKSIGSQTQASLVGGMTPTYAAPEVFRGTPSRHSDQYSLAILYQEMLNGSVPFPGVNAAELTLQHMNDDPDLSRLSEGDRFAVSRALAKDPGHRYESSSEFVAAIRAADKPLESFGFAATPANTDASQPRRTAIAPEASLARGSATEIFDEPGAASRPSDSIKIEPPQLEQPEPVESSAPTEAQDDSPDWAATPAVFVGVGGTGARVLRALRKLLSQRLERDRDAPSAAMLLLDTDPQALAIATRGGGGHVALDAGETVSLPLRRPQAYRSKSDHLLRWLGRRWLYNVPRSLRTEGIRPLGRLALIDHARQAVQRLRGAIGDAASADARAASEQATGVPFRADAVRVYVVASSSGGAGSGMSIDVAYAVRSILAREGIADARLIGVTTHSSFRDATRAELARVNSYAWLSEFEQFRTSASGYPGDAGVGLPAHDAGVAAFDHAYFLPLGDRVDAPNYESAVEGIAEYLYADAFTPTQREFDRFRAETAGGDSALRSFAVRHGADVAVTLKPLERAVVDRLLNRWGGGGEPSDAGATQSTDQVVHGAVAFLGRTQLEPATLASNCRAMLEASLGGDASAYLSARTAGVDASNPALVSAKIDQSFGAEDAAGLPSRVDGKEIASVIEPIAEKLAAECAAWVFGRVDDPQERVCGALRAVAWLRDHVAAVSTDLRKLADNAQAERRRWLEGWESESDGQPDLASKLFQLRLDQAAFSGGLRVAGSLGEAIARLDEELGAIRDSVAAVRSGLLEADEPLDASDDAERVHELALALDHRLQADYLESHGGLVATLADAAAVDEFRHTVAYATHRVVRDADPSAVEGRPMIDNAEFPATPLRDAGGVFRHIAAPESPDDPDAGLRLAVTELAGASLPHVAAELISGRRDYAAFAERVRTRRDLPWIDPVTGETRGVAVAREPSART